MYESFKRTHSFLKKKLPTDWLLTQQIMNERKLLLDDRKKKEEMWKSFIHFVGFQSSRHRHFLLFCHFSLHQPSGAGSVLWNWKTDKERFKMSFLPLCECVCVCVCVCQRWRVWLIRQPCSSTLFLCVTDGSVTCDRKLHFLMFYCQRAQLIYTHMHADEAAAKTGSIQIKIFFNI